MRTAPVVLFVYNRPQHTLRTLEALSANDLAGDSHLIIYADGPKPGVKGEDLKRIEQTREIIRSKQWLGKNEIIEAHSNKGLAQSVIDGVTATINKYGSVIVLEDDLLTAKGFLNYMNEALEKYEKEESVMQISGYNFPAKTQASDNSSFFQPLITSWGWATWKRAWNYFDAQATGYQQLKADKKLSYQFNLYGSYPYADMIIQQMEGKGIDSWAIRWWWSVFKKNGLVLYPSRSLVRNIGFGKESTHTIEVNDVFNSSDFDIEREIQYFPDKIIIDKVNFSIARRFLSSNFIKKESPLHRIKYILSRIKQHIKKWVQQPVKE